MANGESTAVALKTIVDQVQNSITKLEREGQIHLPSSYSAPNALKAAWLTIQETKSRDGKPALAVCKPSSISYALLDMVIQGLNPAKKQCYFIVYGDKLTMMRSYFGAMAVAKEVAGAQDIWAQVVYKGDEFLYSIKRGKKSVEKHIQKIENVDDKNIAAAYCIIELDGGREHTEIMTVDQIKKAWSQGQTYKGDGGTSPHNKFGEEMAKRTVINRACKALINSSNDVSLLFKKHFNEAEEAMAEAQMDEEIRENANKDYIDVEGTVEEDVPFEEVAATEEEPPAEEKPAKGKGKAAQASIEEEGPPF